MSIPTTVILPPPTTAVLPPPPTTMEGYFSKNMPETPDRIQMLPTGPYAVTDRGAVYSFLKGKWLRGHKNNSGYLQVFLVGYDGSKRWYKIHRMVGELYVYNRRPKTAIEVHHKDHNKENNHHKNLKWVTHSENIRLGYEGGYRRRLRPMTNRHHSAEARVKMAAAKVGEKHPKFKGWYVWEGGRYSSLKELAGVLGITTTTAHRLVKKGVVEFLLKTQPSRPRIRLW